MKVHPIAKKIRDLRLKYRWTQAQAADQLGIGLRTLLSYEHGEELNPRPLTLAKIQFAINRIEKAQVAA